MSASAVLAGLLLAVALALLGIGLLGRREALPRNRFVGVRTPAALRSDGAFRAANRVAAPPILTAGVVCLLGAGLALPASGAALAVLAGVSGLGAVLLVAAGGVLGDRAAQVVGTPAGGCGMCDASGCGASTSQLRDSSTG